MKYYKYLAMTRQTLLGALICALALGGASSCKKKGPKKKPDPLIPVKVEPAVSRTLVSEVFLSGEVLADVEVRVFSLVPDRIESLRFEEGDRVKKDQVLAVIKGGALWQAVRQAQAGLTAAKTQEGLAKIELERMRKLYQTNTIAIAALQRAEAQHQVSKAQIKQMEAAVGQTHSTIANVVIRAPIDGVIGQRFLSKGDLAGPQFPLCTIIQTDEVRVKAMATELDVVSLKKAQPVKVNVPAFKNRSWPGQVDYIAPVIDRTTRSAWVTVLVKNPGGLLRPGMFADMRVQTAERPDVIMTLARAIVRRVNEEGKVEHLLYLADGDRAKLQLVSIGQRQGDLIEITKGLKAGDPVVVLGNERLRQGTRIRVIESKPNGVAQGSPAPVPMEAGAARSAPPVAPRASEDEPGAKPRPRVEAAVKP